MRTITFYSYKGGVGRSLLVANTAKYLAFLGKRVFAIDLDLEAPGLHYKFGLSTSDFEKQNSRGLVDAVSDFIFTGELPHSLVAYTLPLERRDDTGSITIMPAGSAPSGAYWKNLSRINWHEMFFGDHPIGVQFFLDLKERIRAEFNPDYILIDARTGITEMGSVATTLLPDSVVCLGLGSAEHLEGLRTVIHGISATATTNELAVSIFPVISRLVSRSDEKTELDGILAFLNSAPSSNARDLDMKEVSTLHTEPLLEGREHLLVGGKAGPHEAVLLQDYLRLFSLIIPAEDVRPVVGQLIQKAIALILDDPDAAQSALESLTAYCADQDAYRALIKLYNVRKAPLEKSLEAAKLMWQLSSSGDKPDSIVVETIRMAYFDLRGSDAQRRFAAFGAEVWRESGMLDVRTGLNIATALMPERRDLAIKMLSSHVENTSQPSAMVLTRLIELLSTEAGRSSALDLIEQFKNYIDDPEFHAAWARLISRRGTSADAKAVLEDGSFKADLVRAADPAAFYRLMKLAGRSQAIEFLQSVLDRALMSEDLLILRQLSELYNEEGLADEFSFKISNRLPAAEARDIVEYGKRRMRRTRFGRLPPPPTYA